MNNKDDYELRDDIKHMMNHIYVQNQAILRELINPRSECDLKCEDGDPFTVSFWHDGQLCVIHEK